MSDCQDPSSIQWVEHVYAALRWAEVSVRELHGLLEHESVDDELRTKILKAVSSLSSARGQAFHALEKTSGCDPCSITPAKSVSSIADETKAQVLAFNAAYLDALLGSGEAATSHAALAALIRDHIKQMKDEAVEITKRLKRELDGPQDPPVH